jgi:WD40 repeat protein
MSDNPTGDWTWINDVADRFERAWNTGPPPRIEDYLAGAEPGLRDALLEELLRVEVELCRAAGEEPTVEEYRQRFPEQAAVVEAVFAPVASASPGAGLSTALNDRTPDTDPAHEPGTRIRYFGDYELIREVGRGGMGIVYSARQISLDRPVALKMIRAGVLAGQEELRRFQNEVEAVAKLDHPHIVPIYEVGEHEGRRYFSMKLIGGRSLHEVLADFAARPRAVADLMVTIAEAVHHAHQRGILHRDLKPSNILLDEQGQPHVGDFGLAKRVGGADDLTITGAVLGTPAYMAPEQAWGRKRLVTVLTDVYGLGAVLYTLLTGKAPFVGESDWETLLQVREQPPVAPSRINAGAPRDLEIICLKCLEKDPQRRYASAQEVANDLRRYLAGEPIVARPVSAFERAVKWARRNSMLAGATGTAAAALVAVAVIAVLYAGRQRSFAEAQFKATQEITGLANDLEKSLKESNRVLATRNFDRAQAAFEKEQIGAGLLWMIESWRSAAAAGDSTWQHAARANVAAWQPYHARLRAVLSHPAPVDAVAFSPDGRTIATGSDDGTARLWDAATGQAIGSALDHGGTVFAVAFSPDGKTLLTGCTDQKARLWDVATHQLVGTPLHHDGPVVAVAVSPDGKTLLTGSTDKKVRLWDATTLQPVGSSIQDQGVVSSVAFSPDGKTLLTGNGIGLTARLWDAATGRSIGTPMQHPGGVNSVSFGPDGKTLLTASGAGFAQLWETATGQALGEPLRHRDRVRAAAISPDGNRFVTGSTDNTARLWDAATRQPIGSPIQHQGPVVSVAFSPDSRTFLTGSSDGTARLWDSEVYEPVRQIVGLGDCLRVAFAADNRTVFTSGGEGPWYWDAKTGRHVDDSWLDQVKGWKVALGTDGKSVLTHTDGETWRVWDGVTCKPLGLPVRYQGSVESLALSPDGKTLLFGCPDRMVRLWDVTAGTPRGGPLEGPGSVDAVAFSPDGKSYLTGYDSGTAQLWDLATQAPLGKPFPHQGCVSAVAFSSDGKNVITGCEDGKARIWDVASRSLVVPPLVHLGWVWSVAFCPDGQTVATGCDDGKVRLWDVGTGKMIGPTLPHAKDVGWLAFSFDGRTIVSGGGRGGGQARIFSNFSELPEDLERVATWVEVITGLTLDAQQGSIQLLDNEAWQARRERLLKLGGPPEQPGEDHEPRSNPARDQTSSSIAGAEPPIVEVASLRDNATDTAESAAFSPDGQRVLTGHSNGIIRLWDRESGRVIRRFAGQGEWKMSVPFSPDGCLFLSGGSDKIMRLWDLDSDKPVRDYKGHTEWVFSLAFSRDGRLAYSTSGGPDLWRDGSDSAVRVWEVESGREVRKLEGHKGRVFGLAVSPDGHHVLTGGDTSLILWDADTGKELRRLRGHTGTIGNAAFLPDGRHAVSGSFDRTIRLWDLDSGQETHRFLGHPREAGWVAVSQDGRRLLSCDYKGHELRLWDLEGYRLIRRIDWGATAPTRGSFSPDGLHAVWCGTGGVVRLYRIPASPHIDAHKQNLRIEQKGRR